MTMRNHVRYRVSLRQVVALDVATHLAVVMGVFLAFTLLSLLVLANWMGGPPLKESPAQILLGCSAAVGAGAAFLLHRLRWVTAVLNHGETVEAKVLRGLHFQFFVLLLVQVYTARGVVQRKLWLPNTRGPRSLITRESLVICVSRDRPNEMVVASLFTPAIPN